MKLIINPKYAPLKKELENILENFSNAGISYAKNDRNQIKVFHIDDRAINVKSFQIPNFLNKIIYKYILKSKARRSFENAQYLLKHNIQTPEPIAYMEQSGLVFRESYYMSEQISYDLTFRELIHQPDYPNNEKILRAFTRFTFNLHENRIKFLDHSPGNTLIQLNNGEYRFFLVDLNRMKFKTLNLENRMENLHRITPKAEMAKIIANEYAKLISEPEEKIFERMWFYIQRFQKKAKRKKFLKSKLKKII